MPVTCHLTMKQQCFFPLPQPYWQQLWVHSLLLTHPSQIMFPHECTDPIGLWPHQHNLSKHLAQPPLKCLGPNHNSTGLGGADVRRRDLPDVQKSSLRPLDLINLGSTASSKHVRHFDESVNVSMNEQLQRSNELGKDLPEAHA
jgi:hypothetical protein